MKKGTKILILIAFIIVSGVSFMVGSHIKEREQLEVRENHCKTLISFAIDKVETQGLSEKNTIAAISSNLYAAYQYCDDSILAAEIHELWNTLLFREEDYIGKEDDLVLRLKSISERIGQSK